MNEDGEVICYRKVGLADTYEHNCKMLRHTLMLLYLSISMVIGKLVQTEYLDLHFSTFRKSLVMV